MENKVLFIARYSNNNIEDNNINFSVNRKVEGILSCFKSLNFKTYILSTSTFNVKRKRKSNFHHNGNIILNYNFTIFNIRYFDYILGIIFNTYYLYKIKKKYKYIIIWNYMPDTLLPVFFNRINKNKLIIDIEERINVDPEASFFFKKFDTFFYKYFRSKLFFSSNESILIPSNKPKLVINGFFSTNYTEEIATIKKLNESRENNKKLKIFFGGRFDKNRGIEILIELIKKDLNYKFEYIVCGFGDRHYIEILNNLKKNFPNLKVLINCDRNIFINELLESDIQLNLLKNVSFASNSFPSKLIELFCLGKIIITNMYLNEFDKSILYVNYDVQSLFDTLLLIKKNPEFYKNFYLNRRNTFLCQYSFSSQSLKLKDYLEIN